MGEGKKPLFEPSFNRAVKVRGGQDRLTSDAGTLLLRESRSSPRPDPIAGRQTVRPPRSRCAFAITLVELLRERLYALAQGYDAQDDVDELAHDPAMRLATWDRPGKRVQEERLASQPTQSRLLAALGNYKAEHRATSARRWPIGRRVTCGPRATTTPRGGSPSTSTAFRFRPTAHRRE